MPDFGISTELSGYATASGTASATQFTIAHGLGMTPTYIAVDGATLDASDPFSWTADGTNITITFSFPPPTGSGNLGFYFTVAA